MKLLAVLVAVVSALIAPGARAAVDIFISFQSPGPNSPVVPGDSLDAAFPASAGWFEIKGVSLGIENTVSLGSTGGAGAGKASFKELTLDKLVNPASVPLLTAAAIGGHYNKVTIAFRKSGGASTSSKTAFLTIEMKTVFIKSIETSSSSGDDSPSERVVLVYGAQKWTYRQQKPDGSYADPVEHTWSQITNSANY